MVSATRDPTDTLPLNSQTAATSIACFMVRDLEETDVPKELATSLAPKKSVQPNAFIPGTYQCSKHRGKQIKQSGQKCNHTDEASPSREI
jgi:hypothetical protein